MLTLIVCGSSSHNLLLLLICCSYKLVTKPTNKSPVKRASTTFVQHVNSIFAIPGAAQGCVAQSSGILDPKNQITKEGSPRVGDQTNWQISLSYVSPFISTEWATRSPEFIYRGAPGFSSFINYSGLSFPDVPLYRVYIFRLFRPDLFTRLDFRMH